MKRFFTKTYLLIVIIFGCFLGPINTALADYLYRDLGVPFHDQWEGQQGHECNMWCWAACTQMILEYWNIDAYDQQDIVLLGIHYQPPYECQGEHAYCDNPASDPITECACTWNYCSSYGCEIGDAVKRYSINYILVTYGSLNYYTSTPSYLSKTSVENQVYYAARPFVINYNPGP